MDSQKINITYYNDIPSLAGATEVYNNLIQQSYN